MTVELARNGDIEIAYEVEGPPDGEPLLLIMGLGLQLVFWPDAFRARLVERGFRVARFDNRDVGLSTHLTGLGLPSVPAILLRSWRGYRIADMAADAVAVLDALKWPSAHLVGVSLGGMIAQTVAGLFPARVRTLTSISSTPAAKIGRPRPRALRALAAGDPGGREASVQRVVDVFRVIGSPAYPLDERWLRDAAARSYDRFHDPDGIRRQLAAITTSGDRRPLLRQLRMPALVVHGDADPLIRPAGGRATAAAIPGAELVTYPGMGHDLPGALQQPIADRIAAVARQWSPVR